MSLVLLFSQKNTVQEIMESLKKAYGSGNEIRAFLNSLSQHQTSGLMNALRKSDLPLRSFIIGPRQTEIHLAKFFPKSFSLEVE